MDFRYFGRMTAMCCLCCGSLCASCVMTARVLSMSWQPVCCLCGGSLCDICTSSSCAVSLEPVLVPACVLDSPGAVCGLAVDVLYMFVLIIYLLTTCVLS